MNDRLSGGPIILIVDADDDPLARCLRESLLAAGYRVRRAKSGWEARIALERANPELILLSLMLPDTDGLTLCANLATRTHTPVVVLSPRRRTVDRVLALATGAFDVLARPDDIERVLTRLLFAPVPKSDWVTVEAGWSSQPLQGG